jgi:uncharacterized membrane protein YvbJ
MAEKITPCPSCAARVPSGNEWCPGCGRKNVSYDFVIVKAQNQEVQQGSTEPIVSNRAKFERKFWIFIGITTIIIIVVIIGLYLYFSPQYGEDTTPVW